MLSVVNLFKQNKNQMNYKKIFRLTNQYQCYIFDMDGVIVDTEPLKFLAYKEVIKKRYDIVLNDDHLWQGKSEVQVFNYWFNKYNIPEIKDLTTLIVEKRQIYKNLLQKKRYGLLLPGIKEFLELLCKSKKNVALATTSNKELQTLIFNGYNLNELFHEIVTLDEISCPKPDPEIYIKIKNNLSIAPNKCIAFEDSPAGVSAAIEAKMNVVGVLTTYPKNKLSGCIFHIKNYLNDEKGI